MFKNTYLELFENYMQQSYWPFEITHPVTQRMLEMLDKAVGTHLSIGLYKSGDIHHYAEMIRRLGDEYGIGVTVAHILWQQELNAGKTPESLLLNNINHPNGYGH
ncbi:hypothetical protein [Cohnella abietis]|nr:hypothetical protein [Cohnella abietis]